MKGERWILPLCLAAQAALLFWRLDLLPVWGDEQFTLDTSLQPLANIPSILRTDIHPPLYYFLVHYWLQIPWAATAIVKARALSGVWALATTALFPRLWIRPEQRWRFLLVWTLSPCLILYGRMARSYTLQLFLGSLALYGGVRLVADPRRRGALALYTICGALVFYTHYLPALAIAGGVQAALLYRAIRKGDAWIAATVPIAIMALLEAPWLMSMGSALARVAHAESYAVTANPALEQTIRLGYLGVSFTVGETAPLWVLCAGGLLALFALFALRLPGLSPIVGLTAIAAYLGATRWVSYAFIPARLLFLLPFYLTLFTRRAWICVALACLSVVSLAAYFRQENFLNKGYLLPVDGIAGVIRERTGERPARLIVNAAGFDAGPLIRRLNFSATARPELIWVLSNREDRAAPGATREIWRAEFVPYSTLDRTAMRIMGWQVRPTHVVQLTEYAAQ